MQYVHYDLGRRSAGEIVEVKLSNKANARLMDDVNFEKYRAAQKYSYSGGMAKKPVGRLTIPQAGVWHLVIDMEGLTGNAQSWVRIITGSSSAEIAGKNVGESSDPKSETKTSTAGAKIGFFEKRTQCPNCRKLIAARETRCPYCGFDLVADKLMQREAAKSQMTDAELLLLVESHKKSGWLAAALNLMFPGAGYIYCGNWFLAIVAFGISVACIYIFFRTFGLVSLSFNLIFFIDGFLCAGRHNKQVINAVLKERGVPIR